MRLILSSKSSISFKKKQGTHVSKNLYFVYVSTKRGKVAHKYNLVIDEGRLLLYSEFRLNMLYIQLSQDWLNNLVIYDVQNFSVGLGS